MKIMRYFPVIALGILGFIVYGLYQTGTFINKKAEAQTLLTQDSLVKKATDAKALSSTPSLLADTLSVATTDADVVAPIVDVKPIISDAKKTTVEVAPKRRSDEDKKKPASATITPKVVAPIASATTPKAATTAKQGSTPTTEPLKTDDKKSTQTRAVVKTPITKAASTATTGTTVIGAKPEIPKSASIEVKKDATEAATFHVIIGSFAQEANAKAKLATFEQKNSKKGVIIKHSNLFRVCADEFEFAQAAAQYAQKLKEAGEESLILKF